jgi:hypothetical protein
MFRKSVHEGGKVVSLKHRSPLPPGKIPGIVLFEADSIPGALMRAEGLNQ